MGRDPVIFGLRKVRSERQEMLELFLDLAAELLLAEVMDQYLHPLLVDIVTARVMVPDAQDRLDIGENLRRGAKVTNLVSDEGCAPHAAACVDFKALLALVVAHDTQRTVVPAQRRAVGGGGDDRDLELARQVAEFGVKGCRLPQELCPRARVADLVSGGARILVGRNIADA